jgi:hypothetical protein
MAGEIGWWNRISSKEKRKNMFAIHCLCMKQRSQRYKKGAELPDILQLPKAVGAYQRPDGTHTPRRGN